MPVQVKICGLKTPEAVNAAIDAGADYLGFVDHHASPRHITPGEISEHLQPLLPPHVKSVIVTVNPDNDWIDQINFHTSPDFIQLHGDESPQRVTEIKERCIECKIIKAIAVRTAEDIKLARMYENGADMLLFDAKPPEDATLPGGNGTPFDWNILRGFSSSLPWFLSGGLTPDNVQHAITQTGAHIVDVSSGVELSAGVKDTTLIEQFITKAKS